MAVLFPFDFVFGWGGGEARHQSVFFTLRGSIFSCVKYAFGHIYRMYISVKVRISHFFFCKFVPNKYVLTQESA